MRVKQACQTFWGYKHDWGKWELLSKQELYTEDKLKGFAVTQFRQCTGCDYTQYDMQKVNI